MPPQYMPPHYTAHILSSLPSHTHREAPAPPADNRQGNPPRIRCPGHITRSNTKIVETAKNGHDNGGSASNELRDSDESVAALSLFLLWHPEPVFAEAWIRIPVRIGHARSGVLGR
ncbi:hypothetical protein DL771_005514 [Monosporascus sp. 5C6A]|nr:hypothetical protein DL771_005514 [Monosporascus sp. 5C6A]